MQDEIKPIIEVKPWWLKWAWWARWSNITVYPHIFTAREGPLNADVYIHEMVHWKQQRCARNRILWYLGYLLWPKFRLKVELEAFTEQIRFWIINGKWNNLINVWLEQELCSWTYFKMMNKATARQWIARTIQEVTPESCRKLKGKK